MKYQIPTVKLNHQDGSMSECLEVQHLYAVVNLGESILLNDSLQPHFTYLEKQFWFPYSFLNSHMKYGIDNEVIAVKEYCNAQQTSVKSSGLWINADYVHLAASSEGLIYDNSNKLCGIVEIKCLNILRLPYMK